MFFHFKIRNSISKQATRFLIPLKNGYRMSGPVYGASTQSNRLAGSVTVVVDERLPNGNLRVSGTKVIELNQGLEVVSITGIVRQQDIQPDNTINSDRIAMAEIRYAGHCAPNAADDLIVEIVRAEADGGPITVVTSDRGLIERLPAGTAVEGARAFRDRVGW